MLNPNYIVRLIAVKNVCLKCTPNVHQMECKTVLNHQREEENINVHYFEQMVNLNTIDIQYQKAFIDEKRS